MEPKNPWLLLVTGKKRAHVQLDYRTPRGTCIPKKDLEKAIGHDYKTTRYALALLSMCSFFRGVCLQKGDPKFTRISRGSVIVMTDQEASGYKRCSFRQGIKRSVSAHTDMANIPKVRLTVLQKLEHDRALSIQARILASIGETMEEEMGTRELAALEEDTEKEK